MKRRMKMREARDAAGTVLAGVGAVFLIFGLVWWSFGIKTLVKFPGGFERKVYFEGKYTRFSMAHGIRKLPEHDVSRYSGEIRYKSDDRNYTKKEAVLVELIRVKERISAPGILFSLENRYMFDRLDARGIKSRLSTSGGRVVDRTGTVFPVFPVDTAKTSYEVFCSDTDSSFPVSFRGKLKRFGLDVYRFAGGFKGRPLVESTIRARRLPRWTTFGSLKAELTGAGVPVGEMVRSAYPRLTEKEKATLASFSDSRKIRLNYIADVSWEAIVEPVSGSVVEVVKNEIDVYVNPDASQLMPLLQILASRPDDPAIARYMSQVQQQEILEPKKLFKIEERWSNRSVKAMVKEARLRKIPILIIKKYVLYGSILFGAALLFTGFLIKREKRHHNSERVRAKHEP